MQVFVNLINNACDASPANSAINIIGEPSDNQIMIAIEDSGTGIDSTVREQIFEPFFTTKSVGKGTGLGLSLVYSIVSNHGGRVRIDDNHTSGTRIVVTLPTCEA